MAVTLEGGCRVSDMREGAPLVNGTLRIWSQIGRAVGAQAISMRVLEFAPGLSPGIRNGESDDILYVLGGKHGRSEPIDVSVGRHSGEVTVFVDGFDYEVSRDCGIYVRPYQTLTVSNPASAPLFLISAQCPEPEYPQTFTPELINPLAANQRPCQPPFVHLADRQALPNADRWYRVLVDHQVGSTQVTQFIGSIPPGRAPDHFHNYEEVLFILKGEGRMWAGETNTQIAPGACIYLPKGQVHCVENTGAEELRLLGVFYPAGSPAVRYDV